MLPFFHVTMFLSIWILTACVDSTKLDTPIVNITGPVGKGTDNDFDGHFVETGDCDDSNPRVHPEANEVCDDIDNDCDGATDELDDSLDRSSMRLFFVDADGDGYGDPQQGAYSCSQIPGWIENGDDCDDNDPDIHPAAIEVCDEIDNNCNTLVDTNDGLLQSTVWYRDRDEDGAGDPLRSLVVENCEQPFGFVTNADDCYDGDAALNPDDVDQDGQSTCDNDCDDNDPKRFPANPEVCDGIDNDCDEKIDGKDDSLQPMQWYADGDRDAFGNPEKSILTTNCQQPDGYVVQPQDCNDHDDQIHPDAVEDCENLIDDDCDGRRDCKDPDCAGVTACPPPVTEVCLQASLWSHAGDEPQAFFGSNVAAAGDVDKDRFEDFLVSAPGQGKVYLFTSDNTIVLSAEDPEDALGTGLFSPGDLNADGLSDVLVGAPQHAGGKIYLFPGSRNFASDQQSVASLVHSHEVSTAASEFGFTFAAAGDVNADGFTDFFVSAPADDAGVVYLFHGNETGELVPTSSLAGLNSGERAGHSIELAGDVDGDGVADLLVGAPHSHISAPNGGAVYVIPAAEAAVSVADSYAVLYGENNGDQAGTIVRAAGDVNNDGLDDILVTAPFYGNGAGKVYIVTKVNDGAFFLTDSTFQIVGDQVQALAGASVAAGKDVDGDGRPDFAIGAPQRDSSFVDAGSVHLFMGEQLSANGIFSLTDAAQELVGVRHHEKSGSAVAFVGDVRNDGTEGLLVGAPENHEYGKDAGYSYMQLLPLVGNDLYYPDADQDGYGQLFGAEYRCLPSAGFVQFLGDCNDANGQVYPSQIEACNDSLDNDCNGLIDAADCACGASCSGEICTNGLDDDDDGLVDCEDAECVDTCQEVCAGELDEDNDGLIDCEDDDCWGTEECGNAIVFHGGTAFKNQLDSMSSSLDCEGSDCAIVYQDLCSLRIQASGELITAIDSQTIQACPFSFSAFFSHQGTYSIESRKRCTDLTLQSRSQFYIEPGCGVDDSSFLPNRLVGTPFGEYFYLPNGLQWYPVQQKNSYFSYPYLRWEGELISGHGVLWDAMSFESD